MPFLRSLAIVAILTASLPAAELQTLTGQKLTGDLVSLDAKQIVIKTANGEVATPIKQVLILDLQSMAAPVGGAKFIDVELIDSTVIHCADIKIKGKVVELTRFGIPNGPGQIIQVPMTNVFSVLRDANDPAVKKEWIEFLAKRGKRDILVVKKEGKFDGLEGTADQGDETGETLAFDLASGKKVNIKLSRLSGLIFNQIQAGEVAETICKVTDTYKNVYAAKEVVHKDGGFTVTTVSGVKVEFPKAQLLSKLDYSQDKITFVSDMEPVDVKSPPKEDVGPTLGKDTNLYGDDTLKLNNVSYGKGLAIHAPTTLTYNLNGDYKEFKAVIGVDDSVVADSQVKFVIEGDGRVLYQAEVRRKDAPKPIVIIIKDVKFLKIIVDSPGVGLHSQIDLADARINK